MEWAAEAGGAVLGVAAAADGMMVILVAVAVIAEGTMVAMVLMTIWGTNQAAAREMTVEGTVAMRVYRMTVASIRAVPAGSAAIMAAVERAAGVRVVAAVVVATVGGGGVGLHL